MDTIYMISAYGSDKHLIELFI